MTTIRYKSIEQFKNVIRRVKEMENYRGKDEQGNPIYVDSVLPTLKFYGTVKIHGTNAGIRYDGNTLTAQSRERDLSLTSDNCGFYVFMHQNYALFEKLTKSFKESSLKADNVVVYGEWCGKGIQKGVAISEVDKKFVIFGIRIINENEDFFIESVDLIHQITQYVTLDELNKNNVYVITQFQTWEIDIDFNSPTDVQNTLTSITDAVENECPVGKYFGVSGIGEGVVWSHNSDKYGLLQMKVKGEKHSNSKVKTLAPVDEEAFAKAEDFAENYTTQARLEQGIHVMKVEMQLDAVTENVGTFIKWVVQDVMKEEQQGIIDNNIDPKKVAKKVSDIARKWYFQQLS